MITPYFLIHQDKVDKQVDDMIKSLRCYWKDGIIGYSFKTNNIPWVINYMKSKSLFAEVVSSDEYELAKCMGFDFEKIIFNGPVKGKDDFIEAISLGSIVNIDSKRELEWLKKCNVQNARIGLRVNFDLEKSCPNETQCGVDDGRFGFSYERGELLNAINQMKKNGCRLSGLHLHCSSKTRSINIYRAIAKIICEIADRYSLELQYVDVGGGFFGGIVDAPSFDEYFSTIYNVFQLNEKMKNVNVIIEPGMSLIGAAIDYVTSVVDVKKTVNNYFVVTDGSRIHIDPLMKKNNYTYSIIHTSRKTREMRQIQTISGFTCMESDRLFKLNNEDELLEGDIITYNKVGAYTVCLSPLFIQFFPAVYIYNEGKEETVRKKWTAQNFIKLGEL